MYYQKSHTKTLRGKQKRPCLDLHNKDKGEDSYDEHTEDGEISSNIGIQDQTKKTLSYVEVNNTLDNEKGSIGEEKKMLNCDKCSYTCFEPIWLEYHMKKRCSKNFQNFSEKIEANKKLNFIDGGGIKCEFCDIKLQTSNSNQNHTLLNHCITKHFHCVECGVSFESQNEITDHVKYHVKNGFDVKCQHCSYTCFDRKSLDYHEGKHYPKHPLISKKHLKHQNKTVVHTDSHCLPRKYIPNETPHLATQYSLEKKLSLHALGILKKSLPASANVEILVSSKTDELNKIPKNSPNSPKKNHGKNPTKSNAKDKLNCDKCSFFCFQPLWMEYHMKKKHSNSKATDCFRLFCGRCGSKELNLRKHLINVHLYCNKCDVQMKSGAEKDEHVRLFHGKEHMLQNIVKQKQNNVTTTYTRHELECQSSSKEIDLQHKIPAKLPNGTKQKPAITYESRNKKKCNVKATTL